MADKQDNTAQPAGNTPVQNSLRDTFNNNIDHLRARVDTALSSVGLQSTTVKRTWNQWIATPINQQTKGKVCVIELLLACVSVPLMFSLVLLCVQLAMAIISRCVRNIRWLL